MDAVENKMSHLMNDQPIFFRSSILLEIGSLTAQVLHSLRCTAPDVPPIEVRPA